MHTQEYVRPAPEPVRAPQEPEDASPEDWARFLRRACAGCHQEPC